MTHIYDKNKNGEIHKCEVCGRAGQNVQHHVAGRRYDDRAIWVCSDCHAKIHNPTAFGLPTSWAYDNNFLLRRSNNMVKEKKTKTCSHSTSYFDKRLGYIKCQFCGQRLDEIKMGKSKKAEPYKKSPAKKQKADATRKSAGTKMGWGQQDPRIGQAEKLKRERTTLEVKIKKEKDPAKHAELEVALGHIVSEMRELQKTYDE